ncbi:MAG: hypothetical protein IPP99_23020 [Chitinophagaceae bacterium]|nr:hypothetical protein [Chitinophagaceae bacterium]
MINIGVLTIEDCKNYSLTGVMARSAGIKRDLRLARTNCYSGYNMINLRSFCGVNGDSYDRFLIRMLEMGESLNIVSFIGKQLLDNYLSSGSTQITSLNVTKFFGKQKKNSYVSMEELIRHFVV